MFAVEVERLDSTSASASMAHGQVQRLVKAVQENVDEKQGRSAFLLAQTFELLNKLSSRLHLTLRGV